MRGFVLLAMLVLLARRVPDTAHGDGKRRGDAAVVDGVPLKTYLPAVEDAFCADIDFARLIKNYSPPRTDGPDWFRPSARVVSTTPKIISGDPKLSRISTRHEGELILVET